MDDATKKEALRLFTYGLYAVTTGDGAAALAGNTSAWNAFTANWLSQVSFDPPLVALSVENAAVSLPLMRSSRRFAVHVFDAQQRDLAGQLGRSRTKHPEKLAGLHVGAGESGCPVLLDTAAWVECLLEGEMPAGDSTLLLGRVVGASVQRQGEPLTMRAAGFKHAG